MENISPRGSSCFVPYYQLNKKGTLNSIFIATRRSTTCSTWVRTFYSIFEVQRLLASPIGCPCISHGKNAMFTDFQFFGVCLH